MENIGHARSVVGQWSDQHNHAVLFDDESATLLDVESGKTLKLSLGAISRRSRRKSTRKRQDRYLVLLFDDGKQIALVDPGGVAFAPSTENSGPVKELPPVVCLRDFLTLKQRVDHYIYDHPDEPPPRECLDMIMICIATLDGARAVGFDVGDLEGELEKSLNEVERRTTD